MNNVFLIGRLTRDPELRFTPGKGTAITRFSLAVTRYVKDGENTADFINCVAFGKKAETISTYCIKGSKVAIGGNLKTGSYEKEGITRYTVDVLVENFEFCSNSDKKENDNSTDSVGQEVDDDMTPVDDGDMPF